MIEPSSCKTARTNPTKLSSLECQVNHIA